MTGEAGDRATNTVDAAPALAFDDAWRALRADDSYQFQPGAAPPEPDGPPAWLEAAADLLDAVAPLLALVFWAAVAALVGFIAWMILRELRLIGARGRIEAAPEPGFAEWRPEADAARDLLADADALAAQGRFEEAAHLILLRSIEDIRLRRPGAVRPDFTTRDIAASRVAPPAARGAFARIGEAVELSLFGGRPLDAETFAACRAAYAAFALPGEWAR